MKTNILIIFLAACLAACNSNKKAAAGGGSDIATEPVGPAFNADSAYAYCKAQCDFGPRTMNSEAHDRCGDWIMAKFRQFGCTVTPQRVTLDGYDGTPLRSTNIIASYRPELPERILLCAHWDSRPWADNDPDSANWRKPVMGANDGASGVAVLLEVARQLGSDTTKLNVGVDFVCFDAEDWGVPRWSTATDNGDSWALGAQHWSANPHKAGYKARFGILLDMVGGQPVNEKAKIPTIDIIPFYPDCKESSFGPTWHTVNDTMENIDKATLGAVGQTVIQVLYSEK